MSGIGLVALSFLVLAASGPNLHGEDHLELARGSRIRVRTEAGGEHWTRGTLVTLDAGRLMLQTDPGKPPITVERRQVTRLDVSSGRGRRTAAAIGAGVGVSLAAVFAFSPSDSGESLCSGSGCVGLFALSSGVFGGTGALVGALVAPERWREVPLASPAVSLEGVRGAIGVALPPVPGDGAAVVVTLRW